MFRHPCQGGHSEQRPGQRGSAPPGSPSPQHSCTQGKKTGLNISAMTEEGTKPPLCGSFSQLAWFLLDEFHVLTFVSSKSQNKQTGAIFKLQERFLSKVAPRVLLPVPSALTLGSGSWFAIPVEILSSSLPPLQQFGADCSIYTPGARAAG